MASQQSNPYVLYRSKAPLRQRIARTVRRSRRFLSATLFWLRRGKRLSVAMQLAALTCY